MLVEALSSGIAAGGHVIAVLPQWFPAGRRSAPRNGALHAGHGPRRGARHGAAAAGRRGAVLARLRARRLRPVRGRARLAAARDRGGAARLHLARLGLRPQRTHANIRPAPRLARARTARSASPRGPSRPCTSSPPASPACRCRRSCAPRGWSSRRAPATPPGRARRSTRRSAGCPSPRSSRRPTGPRGGGPARSSRAWCSRSTSPELAEELLAELEPWLCRWCRELIASSPCPLCGHRGRPVRRRAPAAHQQGGSASRCREPGCGPSRAPRRSSSSACRSGASPQRRGFDRTITAVERSRVPVAQLGSQISVSTSPRPVVRGLPQPAQRSPSSRCSRLTAIRAGSIAARLVRSTTPMAPAASPARAPGR